MDAHYKNKVTGGFNLSHDNSRITTAEAAINKISERMELMKQSRIICDVRIPVDNRTLAESQKKNERVWLMRLGEILGMCTFAHDFGIIDDTAYDKLRQEALQTMMPTYFG